MAWEEDSNLEKTGQFQGAAETKRYIFHTCSIFLNDGGQILASSLEEGLFCSLRLLLGKKCRKLRAGAGVGELGGGLGGAAAVLHVQILHEQHLTKTKAPSNKDLFPWLNSSDTESNNDTDHFNTSVWSFTSRIRAQSVLPC